MGLQLLSDLFQCPEWLLAIIKYTWQFSTPAAPYPAQAPTRPGLGFGVLLPLKLSLAPSFCSPDPLTYRHQHHCDIGSSQSTGTCVLFSLSLRRELNVCN